MDKVKIGSVIVSEALDEFLTACEIIGVGKMVRFKVIKQKNNWFVAENRGKNRIIVDDNLCDRESIRTIEPCIPIPTGAKLRFYLEEEK